MPRKKKKGEEKNLQQEMNDLKQHMQASNGQTLQQAQVDPLATITETYEVANLKETLKFAHQFAHGLNGGEVVLLFGEMGSGKTTFTKEVIKALGFKGIVNSPTFTIMQEYYVRKFKLMHYDLYRLENPEEGYNFGLQENIKERDINTILFVEWPERAMKILKGDFVVVQIAKTGEESRTFTVSYEKV